MQNTQGSLFGWRIAIILLACMLLTAYSTPVLWQALRDGDLTVARQRLAQTGGTGIGGYVIGKTTGPERYLTLCADRSGSIGYPASVRQQAAQRWHVVLPPC